MSLFKRLTSGGRKSWSQPNFWDLQDDSSYPLLSTSIQGNREVLGNDFEAYIQGAYKESGVIFACVQARQLAFSEARYAVCSYEEDGRPGELRYTPDIELLQYPWPGGSIGDLLSRMELDASLAGNFYATVVDDAGRTGVRATGPGRRIVRLRPDWVTIIIGSKFDLHDAHPYDVTARVVAYEYNPPVSGTQWGVASDQEDTLILLPEDICHYSPIPDPAMRYRGMSWITPIVSETKSDKAATKHKLKFFELGAAPKMAIALDKEITPDQFHEFAEAFKEQHQGVDNAYKTLFLAGGASVTGVGADLRQLDFKSTQGAGETRIAAASGVPPIIVGLSEGLASATYCLPYTARVWTPEGPRPIGEIRPGDEVWSHVDGGLAVRPVLWQGQTGTKQVYRIQTKNRVLRATGNHPVLVRVPGKSNGSNAERSATVAWRNVDELVVGDQVVQVQQLPDLGVETIPTGGAATVDLLQWMGAYTGDGSGLNRDGGEISMAMADKPPREHYEKLACDLFDLEEVKPTTRAFRFHSRETHDFLRDLGLSGTAKTKRIPSWVFGLTLPLRLAYLAGLVDTDGSVDRRGTAKFQHANRELVEDIKMLLIGCGIQVSNLYHHVYDASVLPNPGLHDTYEAWAIVCSSAEEVSSIPFVDWRYRERVEANTGRRKRCGGDAAKAGLSDDLGFFKVCAIQPEDVEPVYDIEVDDGHSFVTEGVVVHNSNYGQARRRFADNTIRPLWRTAGVALGNLVNLQPGEHLRVDDRDIAFLREDLVDQADIQAKQASQIRQLIDGGFDPDAAVRAVMKFDLKELEGEHTGLVSVQLLPPGLGTIDPVTGELKPPDPAMTGALGGGPQAAGGDTNTPPKPGGAPVPVKRDFSTQQREDAAEQGHALDDGSYPIKNEEDLRNAIRLAGHGNAGKARIRAHIRRRARALGLTHLIPDEWSNDD